MCKISMSKHEGEKFGKQTNIPIEKILLLRCILKIQRGIIPTKINDTRIWSDIHKEVDI